MRELGVVFAGLLILSPSVALAQPNDVFLEDSIRTCTQSSADAKKLCEFQIKSFRDDYRKAYKKGYTAQRNVAFCLSDTVQDGCDGAVKINLIAACAWRMVVLASGSTEVGTTDIWNYRGVCGPKRMANAERALALTQAEEIFRKIYKRELPLHVILSANEATR